MMHGNPNIKKKLFVFSCKSRVTQNRWAFSTFTPSSDQAGTLALTYLYNPVACPISIHPLCLRSC